MEVKRRDGSKVILGSKETQAQTIARLEAEKQALEASTLEITSYVAAQDARLVQQEQAILELTMLVAGGNA